MERMASQGNDSPFRTLLRSVRGGDNGARAQLYLEYGPYFRRVIQKRLEKRRIAWATTAHDVFDAVMLRIWEEDALEELADEPAFLKYMARVVSHAVQDEWRGLTRHCRDYRRAVRLAEFPAAAALMAAATASPAERDAQLQAIRSRWPEGDQPVLELWLGGAGWNQIAARLGGRAETLRKRFCRALADVRREVTRGREAVRCCR